MSDGIQCSTRRGFVRGSIALTAGVALAPGLARAQGKPLVTGSFGPAITLYAPFMVVEVEGLARAEGLDFKIVVTDGGARTRQVIAAGQASHAHGDASHPLQLTNRGKPTKILMGTESRCPYANIVVRKDLYDQGITTPEKFGYWKRPDGSKPVIAATAIGSGTWMYGSYVLERYGVAEKVNWVAAGGAKTMLGGLSSKQLDAIVASPAIQFDAEDRGWGRVIYDVRDQAAWDRAFGGPIPTTAVYALASTTQAPDVTQAFVNAVYRAMQWLKAHGVDEIYARVGEKYMGDQSPQATKREIAYFKQLWKYDGMMSEADFRNGGKVWFREGTDIKPISFADAVDARFLVNAHRKYSSG
ncbi:MAG: ABC transporter substrate-binding protein [Candidatus Rokubacteria bacterium]|nr:ABC transporter substrate-binding protein [Candidatus Rokubacteria bacterium]